MSGVTRVSGAAMIRAWILSAGIVLPALALACDSGDRQLCKKQFRELVAYRAEAIDAAFGNPLGALPQQLDIKFVTAKDSEHVQFAGREGYDRLRRRLIFPRRALGANTPNPLRWAAYYWPYYRDEHRLEFPVIEIIDNVLWDAFLQEAAATNGLPWPHEECGAVDVARRLPCEMLVAGIAEHVKAVRGPLFNSNRLDRIWPEDFAAFHKRMWRTDTQYQEVQRYGGILLMRPLIDEFGVRRALTYAARTPFRVEQNNVRLSALHYQERARKALSAPQAQHTKPAPAMGPAWDTPTQPSSRRSAAAETASTPGSAQSD